MNKAFTLIELLVVVMIIGILATIALPKYQTAVDKSRFATLLPTTRSLKTAQESFYMSNGYYAEQMQDLAVQAPADTNYTLKIKGESSDYNVIQATHANLDNVRLASYLDKNSLFAGQLHCEAKVGDERANKLCDKLSMGNKLIATSDNYMGYLLNEEIGQQLCGDTSKFWSTSKSHCYQTQEDKCNAVGGDMLSDGQCGYEDGGGHEIGTEKECIVTNHSFEQNKSCNKSTIKNGGSCVATGGVGCVYVTIEEGGLCVSEWGDSCSRSPSIKGTIVCNGGGYCGYANTVDGGVCIGNFQNNCIASTYKNGAICWAGQFNSCGTYDINGPTENKSKYEDTACCCGPSCPDYAPYCGDSACDAFATQYAEYIK